MDSERKEKRINVIKWIIINNKDRKYKITKKNRDDNEYGGKIYYKLKTD